MCEKLVPKKGTFFCADKVCCPLRQHLFIPHILMVSFSLFPSVTTLVHTSYIDKKPYARSPLQQYSYLFHILRCVVKARFPLWQYSTYIIIFMKSSTHVALNCHYEQTLVCVVISLFSIWMELLRRFAPRNDI